MIRGSTLCQVRRVGHYGVIGMSLQMPGWTLTPNFQMKLPNPSLHNWCSSTVDKRGRAIPTLCWRRSGGLTGCDLGGGSVVSDRARQGIERSTRTYVGNTRTSIAVSGQGCCFQPVHLEPQFCGHSVRMVGRTGTSPTPPSLAFSRRHTTLRGSLEHAKRKRNSWWVSVTGTVFRMWV